MTYQDFGKTSCVVFKVGKNPDGYFDNDNLEQVGLSMVIFVEKNSWIQETLFLFDNAMTHQKRAPDLPSAHKMLKGPKLSWTPCPGGPKCETWCCQKSIQYFYFPGDNPSKPGWFKGMKVVLEKQGLWQLQENGRQLNEECMDFKCPKGLTTCCCHILFN